MTLTVCVWLHSGILVADVVEVLCTFQTTRRDGKCAASQTDSCVVCYHYSTICTVCAVAYTSSHSTPFGIPTPHHPRHPAGNLLPRYTTPKYPSPTHQTHQQFHLHLPSFHARFRSPVPRKRKINHISPNRIL